MFDTAKLAAYDAIVLNNCRDMTIPEGAPREALLDFVRNGKGIRVPIAETWGAMENLVRAGLVRRIGVANFGTSLLRDLLSYSVD